MFKVTLLSDFAFSRPCWPDMAKGTKRSLEDPKVRHTVKAPVKKKKGDDGGKPEAPHDVKTEESSHKSLIPPFSLEWDNIDKVMKFYKLNEGDAGKLLNELIGPDPRGADFWKRYADRIKREADAVSWDPSAPPAPPVLPDNQLGDPTLNPDYDPNYDSAVDGTFVDESLEGEEEEDIDGDPIVESDDEIPVPANGGGGDDHDSPSPGACSVRVPAEQKVQVCVPQPVEPCEAVRGGVEIDKCAADARDALAEKLKSTPTPSKQGRIIQKAVRVEDPDEDLDQPLKSLLHLAFCEMFMVILLDTLVQTLNTFGCCLKLVGWDQSFSLP